MIKEQKLSENALEELEKNQVEIDETLRLVSEGVVTKIELYNFLTEKRNEVKKILIWNEYFERKFSNWIRRQVLRSPPWDWFAKTLDAEDLDNLYQFIKQILLNNNNIIKDINNKQLKKEKLEITKEKEALLEITKEKEAKIEEIWEKRTLELQQWFNDLKNEYATEERKWLVVSLTVFVVLIISSFLPICVYIWLIWSEKIIFWFLILVILLIYTFMLATDKNLKPEEKWIEKVENFIKKRELLKILLLSILAFSFGSMVAQIDFQKKWNLDFSNLLPFVPFELITLTFLYFCVYQFSKAKNLRIEHQNKIAIISWYKALLAHEEMTWKEIRMSHFLPNISNVLFCKSNDSNDSNLPIEKIMDLAKIAKETSR
ncbi:MAG: hypothetical protein ACD_2C00177G0005 [uncultured bacterium (gcode 4)]|uniref:Uncharacterized protein n=1 Tax=uncultured bacterium (gcode 4) TaxID=1234023 RepID=K2GG97_9BACT|nr:MAG: hypothetical protein ACD_2C00177G0005 [uncultured bacterium (gcode 4)]